MVHTYNGILLSHKNEWNNVLAATWMDLETFILRERQIYITFMCYLKKMMLNQTWEKTSWRHNTSWCQNILSHSNQNSIILVYTHTQSGMAEKKKKNEIFPFATTWIELEGIMLSKPEGKRWIPYHLTYVQNFKKQQTKTSS